MILGTMLVSIKAKRSISLVALILAATLAARETLTPNKNDFESSINNHRGLQNDPYSVQRKPFDKNTVISLINTVKSGADGMHVHFANSFDCVFRTTKVNQVHLAKCNNLKGVDVLNSHHRENSMALLSHYLDTRLSRHRPLNCLVVTAVRNPKTWLPARFMEDEGNEYCDKTRIGPERTVEEFRKWLVDNAGLTRFRASSVVPYFLELYGTTITEQMKVFERNGGFSLLPPPIPARVFPPGDNNNRALKKKKKEDDLPVDEDLVKGSCSLLLLQYEQADKWQDVMGQLAPGIEFRAAEEPETVCPEHAAINEYQISDEERENFIGHDRFSPYLKEWFHLYGIL